MNQPKEKRMDAQKNKAHIIEIASSLFASQGVEAVSMQKIAKNAGVGAGTLYRHFKDKSALCLELIDEDVKSFYNKVKTYLKDYAHAPVRNRIDTLIGFIIDLKEENLAMLTAIENSGDKDKSFLQTPFYQFLKHIFTDLFTEVPNIKDPEFHTDLLLNAFSSDIYAYQRFENQLSAETLRSKLVDSFLM